METCDHEFEVLDMAFPDIELVAVCRLCDAERPATDDERISYVHDRAGGI
jgi:hypothetical protein